MIIYLVSFAFGFAIGMIPFSYILGRIKGVDLKTSGSGNIGATNLGRKLGMPFFIMGFILDALKGLAPVLLARSLSFTPALAGAGAIAGHIFNPFFRFKGGKGVSTTVGVALGLTPKSFLLAIAVWLIIYLATFIVSLASLCLAFMLPVIIIILKEADTMARILMIVICILIIVAHNKNIKRLINGTEPKTIFWGKK
ncbi:MAG TPA: glycerol-3-phosphate 1-O-acyltransferase PlsY [bacterium]